MNLPQTVVHALHDRASQLGDRPALWTVRNGRYRPTSWRDYEQRVKHLALGLSALGLEPAATVGIVASNREEWLVAYLAALASGAVPVAVDPALEPAQLARVLGHARVQVLVVENAALLERALPSDGLPSLKRVVMLDPPLPRPENVHSYVEVLSQGLRESDTGYWERLNGLEPSALATVVYTAGTTAPPKGVMLSHRNLAWTTLRLCDVLGVEEGDSILSWAPLARISEQLTALHAPLALGLEVYFGESPTALAKNLRDARPTVLLAAPRIWEELWAKAESETAGLPRVQSEVLQWARRATLRRHALTFVHDKVPTELEAQYRLAQRLVLSPLKERLGFGRSRVLASTGTPLGVDALEYFASIDLVIREFYGQTETTGVTAANTFDATRLGAVGRPLVGVEVRIGEDGEVRVRGENVCLGYFRDRAATDALFDDGGWLRTGDLGELDGQGFLRITGRRAEGRARRKTRSN